MHFNLKENPHLSCNLNQAIGIDLSFMPGLIYISSKTLKSIQELQLKREMVKVCVYVTMYKYACKYMVEQFHSVKLCETRFCVQCIYPEGTALSIVCTWEINLL